MGAANQNDEFECTSSEAWHEWLSKHHASSTGVWLITHKKASPEPTLDYEDMVLEALCWGWVDSKVAGVDQLRSKTYFTPRRANSTWSASNRARVARLFDEGRMQAPGIEAVEKAQASGRWG